MQSVVVCEPAVPQRFRARGTAPLFPTVVWMNGRGFVPRSDLDWYKAQLLAFAQGVAPVEPPRVDPDPFIPLKAVGAELGIGRRTVGRRIAESQAASGESVPQRP
jgi:hypothetical protein